MYACSVNHEHAKQKHAVQEHAKQENATQERVKQRLAKRNMQAELLKRAFPSTAYAAETRTKEGSEA